MIRAQRMNGLESAIFTDLEQARRRKEASGTDCINFSIGTPDLPPPDHIIEVISRETARAAQYRYAICDLPELTLAVEHWYQRRYGVWLPSGGVQSLMGSQEGLAHIALTMINPGDVVLVPDPGYPIFSVGPLMADARLVRVPLRAEDGWRMDLDSIPPDVAASAKLLIASYPNNPTCAVAPPGFYRDLVRFAKQHDIVVVHDNAYSELTDPNRLGASFLAEPGAMEVGIEFNSLSKTWNIPGCRISFAVGNPDIIASLRLLKSHLDYGVFLPFQHAAIAALNGPQTFVETVRDTYMRRRKTLVAAFAEAGWHLPEPAGTMFAWAPLPQGWTDSMAFSMHLIETAGIMVVPGISFGPLGEGYVRIALVEPESRIREAAERLRATGALHRV